MLQRAGRNTPGLAMVACGAFVLLALFALSVPIDHDEGQYIAATRLVAEGWRPILDFPYLQTPLQPYLLAPLEWLAPGWLLVSSRVANALFVALSAYLVGRTAKALSGRASVGVAAATLLLLCDSVQFAGSVARNDALPLLLVAWGLERLWSVPAPGRWRSLVAGILLAAAASTKISYALPVAAVAATHIWRDGLARPKDVAALLFGMAIGAVPTLVTLAAAPYRAWFWMVSYSVEAVEAFQTLNGSIDQLGWPRRLARFAKFAAMGPLLVLLGLAAWTAWRRRAGASVGPWIGPVLLAALLAAILPMPVYRQYLVPLAIPLLLWLAANDGFAPILAMKRGAIAALVVLVCAAGTFRSAKEAIAAPASERPLAVSAEAQAIGRAARAQGMTKVASLDAIRATDSGLEIDRRFAPGPFLFRAGNLADCRDEVICPVTFANLAPIDRAPPQLILVTGTEDQPVGHLRHGLESVLVRWARSRGAKVSSVGGSTLYRMSRTSRR